MISFYSQCDRRVFFSNVKGKIFMWFARADEDEVSWWCIAWHESISTKGWSGKGDKHAIISEHLSLLLRYCSLAWWYTYLCVSLCIHVRITRRFLGWYYVMFFPKRGVYIILFSSLLLAINKLNRVEVIVFLFDYITKILSIVVNLWYYFLFIIKYYKFLCSFYSIYWKCFE